MYFEDVVKIKEADCCEKCISFEYDLPCRIDKELAKSISLLFGLDKMPNFADLNKSNVSLQIKKSEDLKVELKSNSRYLKLCLPASDMVSKDEVEDLLANWISDTLHIEIERKNG